MLESNIHLVGLGAVAATTLAFQIWSRRCSPQPPLPPSPRTYPLIGNLLSMPQKDEHFGFIELGKRLNANMFSLSTFGTTVIVLNSVEDATNLLDKRSGIYSDRLCPPMMAEPSLLDWSGFVSLLGYNDRWRKIRRLIHPWLHRKAAESFHESQQREARQLLLRLARSTSSLDNSEKLYDEFFLTTAIILMHSIYGYHLQSLNDPLMQKLQVSFDIFLKVVLPSNFLVNVFPALRHIPEWFPGAGWKRTAREWRKEQKRTIKEAYDWTKTRIASGERESSMIGSMISHAEKLGLSTEDIDDHVSQIAFTLLGAGIDTSANVLLAFVVAMVLYPETQTKAQQEIDAVVGTGRLPTMKDRCNLPYTNRLIKEVMRWCPTVPTGVPHACYQDDIYKGYRIPKGAIVIGNAWAMSRDERFYKDPERFNPDRFLDPSVPPLPAFGFGRRLCPGIHFAESSIFIGITSVLAAFNISMAKDDNGEYVIPNLDSENELIFHPKPFKLKLELRSEHHANLIRAGASEH